MPHWLDNKKLYDPAHSGVKEEKIFSALGRELPYPPQKRAWPQKSAENSVKNT